MRSFWIFGNQLSHELEMLEYVKDDDVIVMIEATSRAMWRTYHKQKLVLIFSAMRHFAGELRDKGYTVDYHEADSFQDAWDDHFTRYEPKEIHYTAVTDAAMEKKLQQFGKTHKLVEHSDVPLFYLTKEESVDTLGNAPWRMDRFYRHMRKRFDVLLEDGKPRGGKWSFDADNREPPKAGLTFAPPIYFRPDDITKDVIEKVERDFADNPGDITPFVWQVTHAEAHRALDRFIEARLETFGPYQDAMLSDNQDMSHSLLSAAINTGLLTPREVVEAACAADAPLASIEGFVRQIFGWREYMRAVYVASMPGYESVNTFKHERDLPDYFWDAKTDMHCVHQSVKPVIERAHNHHIQRLMVLGNFATLFEVSPQQTSDWFNEMYIDAYDWVVLPNVLGMALHADGGKLATKPYIASGKYIDRMSDYCKGCTYNPKHTTEEDACPFNALYWNFIDKHEERFADNQRMKMMLRNWQGRDDDVKADILAKARQTLDETDSL
ncbi:cryptochrome/photolyase family protein [Exiguobacterium sp.]|uniref:cryptochrome/photolyase family protein n=1 Tax=Exiguobacterium sp. TaxID=44751 RepID=UPI00263A569F|nr:cryptochrome/photolyase family protein [Exiguobacterium sp.]MCC5891186.1 cryptochrome/photolyase family protein [Exiguobacterium sp.]